MPTHIIYGVPASAPPFPQWPSKSHQFMREGYDSDIRAYQGYTQYHSVVPNTTNFVQGRREVPVLKVHHETGQIFSVGGPSIDYGERRAYNPDTHGSRNMGCNGVNGQGCKGSACMNPTCRDGYPDRRLM